MGGQLADNYRPVPISTIQCHKIYSFPDERERVWLGGESNSRHEDFQSSALPTELPSRIQTWHAKIALMPGAHYGGFFDAGKRLHTTHP